MNTVAFMGLPGYAAEHGRIAGAQRFRSEGGEMIVDRIENATRYAGVHPRFARAFEFLREAVAGGAAKGPHVLDGSRLRAVCAEEAGRPREQAVLEAHRRYIDIHLLLSGSEEMGWASRSQCARPKGDYDTQKDVEFFLDPPRGWIRLQPGDFVVVFPEDAHAPLVGAGPLNKVVVKVRV
jgi:YhcH/YjgK/YiaL family protein